MVIFLPSNVTIAIHLHSYHVFLITYAVTINSKGFALEWLFVSEVDISENPLEFVKLPCASTMLGQKKAEFYKTASSVAFISCYWLLSCSVSREARFIFSSKGSPLLLCYYWIGACSLLLVHAVPMLVCFFYISCIMYLMCHVSHLYDFLYLYMYIYKLPM